MSCKLNHLATIKLMESIMVPDPTTGEKKCRMSLERALCWRAVPWQRSLEQRSIDAQWLITAKKRREFKDKVDQVVARATGVVSRTTGKECGRRDAMSGVALTASEPLLANVAVHVPRGNSGKRGRAKGRKRGKRGVKSTREARARRKAKRTANQMLKSRGSQAIASPSSQASSSTAKKPKRQLAPTCYGGKVLGCHCFLQLPTVGRVRKCSQDVGYFSSFKGECLTCLEQRGPLESRPTDDDRYGRHSTALDWTVRSKDEVRRLVGRKP